MEAVGNKGKETTFQHLFSPARRLFPAKVEFHVFSQASPLVEVRAEGSGGNCTKEYTSAVAILVSERLYMGRRIGASDHLQRNLVGSDNGWQGLPCLDLAFSHSRQRERRG
ncbi:hypothetical protein SUGI_0447890 [Cryptomeria japonica]|nr:hypothetical protein SUGI_0447890 [Cryptomeria japonica]